jgi:hypothetical protein
MVNEKLASSRPGPVVLFGSGETSASGRAVFDRVLKELRDEPRLALLETPAGFELNSAQVIGRVAQFLEHRLQNYRPQVQAVPARARGTEFSPDDPEIAAPLLEADLIFMGPGSPTYAVRQLQDSLAWHYTLARQRLGAALVLASAATIAASAYALPVYEIYKVGEDLGWKPGLDFFGLYGMPLVFIPHWNNNEGGNELDTSRCFMGQPRFQRLMEMLPSDLTVLGVDEHTALIMDLDNGLGRVVGRGGVTVIHTGHQHEGRALPDLRGSGLAQVAAGRHAHVHQHHDGQAFPLADCCAFEVPAGGQGLPAQVWARALEVEARLEAGRQPAPQSAPPEVLALVEQRQAARARKDWPAADQLREQIGALGWAVQDTPQGPELTER